MSRAAPVRPAGIPKAIVLGGGRGIRHLDPTKSYPASLQEIGSSGRALDWILQALAARGVERDQAVFVGGYHLEKVVDAYPGLPYFFHAAWDREGEAGALRVVEAEIEGPCFICSTSVVFRREALDALVSAGGDGALGALWEASGAGSRLAPIVWLGPHAAGVLRATLRKGAISPASDLVAVVSALRAEGVDLRVADVTQHCSEIKDASSLARFVLGSKAQTLERIRPLLRQAVVLEQVRFTVREWRADPSRVLDAVRAAFADRRVVVRSSAALEDSWTASHAGRFRSILDVDPGSLGALEDAVRSVVAEYEQVVEGALLDRSEVFVQPHLRDVAVSGVVLTRDLETGGPYYVVTMDRSTGRTDSVTAGSGAPQETHVIYRNAEIKPQDEILQGLIPLVKEIEALVGHDGLDIEFAVDKLGRFHVFQVRPLVGGATRLGIAESDFDRELAQVREFADVLFGPHPHLAGRTTVLSNMSDWNPAEMIGIAPRPLALSLYQVLITDRAWAEARRQMGYRDVTSEPLLVSLAGVPYMDVRVSLNSFLPATVGQPVASRVVDAYLDHLRARPSLHDKVEFEVAVTCLAFDFDHHAKRLREAGLGAADVEVLRVALLQFTDAVLRGDAAPISEQIDLVNRLERRREAVLASSTGPGTVPRVIRHLVQDCIRYGTTPFSVLARHAFIAMSLLKSLKREGVFTGEEYAAFLNDIPSIATEVSRSLAELQAGRLTREAFVERFGHLRPGTYDILSPNYARAIDVYASGTPPEGHAAAAEGNLAVARGIFDAKRDRIAELLAKSGFTASPEQLFDYLVRAIPAREWAKFEFTKNVNAVLELVAAFAAQLGLTREDASFLSIERVMRFATDSVSGAVGNELLRTSGFEAKRHVITTAVRLPHVITRVEDLTAFRLLDSQPNFITTKRVVAEVVDLETSPAPQLLEGRIALIRSADPGYDWIFGYRIAGLVTQFGGVASHMAIRAAEFGLPSVIGAGDVLFERVRKARKIEIDAAAQQVRVIS